MNVLMGNPICSLNKQYGLLYSKKKEHQDQNIFIEHKVSL